MHTNSILIMVALAGIASAQTASDSSITTNSTAALSALSPTCAGLILSYAGSTTEFGNCLAIGAFAGVFQAKQSMAEPLDNWLSSMCNATCASNVLMAANSSVSVQCATDITAGNLIIAQLQAVIQNYPGFRELFCLRRVSPSESCHVELIKALQSASNSSQFTTTSIASVVEASVRNNISVKAIVCTACVAATIAKIPAAFPEYANITASLIPFFDPVCGNGSLSLDNSLPPGVIVAQAGSFPNAAVTSTISATATSATATGTATATATRNPNGAMALHAATPVSLLMMVAGIALML